MNTIDSNSNSGFWKFVNDHPYLSAGCAIIIVESITELIVSPFTSSCNCEDRVSRLESHIDYLYNCVGKLVNDGSHCDHIY